MGKWTIRIDDSKMSMLRNYGSCYKHGGGAGGYFDFFGDSLQEAADSLIHVLVDAFSDDSVTILEYPEHAIIEERIHEYANCAEKHITLIFPCKCQKYKTGIGDITFKTEIRIILQEQKMQVAEMRALLDESRVAFSKQYNIPVRTLENWESGKSQCPEYVRQLLERAVREDAKVKNDEANTNTEDTESL